MSRYISFLILINFGLNSGLVQGETLLEVYQLAKQYDLQLKIANQKRIAILEKNPQAQAQLLPKVTLNANVFENLRFDNGMFERNMDTENTNIGYTVSFNYPLYRKDLRIQLQQVDSEIAKVEADYETAKQDLMERVTTSYS